MTCRVQVARTAARQLADALPEAVATACVEFLYGPLAENPRRVGAPLRKPLEGGTGGHAEGSTEFVTPSTTRLPPCTSLTSATGGTRIANCTRRARVSTHPRHASARNVKACG